MNRAVSGNFQPGARENVAYLTSTERRREFEKDTSQDRRQYEVWSCFVILFANIQIWMIWHLPILNPSSGLFFFRFFAFVFTIGIQIDGVIGWMDGWMG